MAFVLTYDGLVQLVKDYLERNDANLVNNIPNFVLIAQRRIGNDLKSLLNDVSFTGFMVTGSPYIAKPNQWLNTVSFNMGINATPSATGFTTFTPITLASYEFCTAYWSDAAQNAQPKYYAEVDYQFWYISPTPDQDYPFEIILAQFPTALDSANGSNLITQFAPHLLEYATLREAMIFIKDDERIQFFETAYQTALAGMLQDDKKRLADRFYNREAD
jgi:hypothetical protein